MKQGKRGPVLLGVVGVVLGCAACGHHGELDNGFVRELAMAPANKRAALADQFKEKPIVVSGTITFISGAQTTNLHLDVPEAASGGNKMDVGVNLLTSLFDSLAVEGDTMSLEGGRSAVLTVSYPNGKTRTLKRGDHVVARGSVGYLSGDDLLWVAGATLE